MLKKVKVYSALSLVLSLSAIAFYGTLGTPVGIAVVALVLGVSAYTAVNVLIKLSVDDGK